MDMNTHQFVHSNDLELHDFTGDANFDRFINLIRGQNDEQICGYDFDLFNTFLDIDNQQQQQQFVANNPPIAAENIFNFGNPAMICHDPVNITADHQTNYATNTIKLSDPVTLSSFISDTKNGDDIEEDDDNSSGATNATKTKSDRSRTLISERKRRGKMKEKLYALRSLVPNITKMDKASIIGDAVIYVQELQMKAKRLKAEILALETSLIRSEKFQDSSKNTRKNVHVQYKSNRSNRIMRMDVIQVEEGEFYVKLVCTKGEGVARSLYTTLESLTSFKVQSSNMVSVNGNFVLTFNLSVKEGGKDMNLPNLKLWITGALLNQGFEFLASNL